MDGSPVRVPPLGAADRGNLIDDLDQESITVSLRLNDGGPASCLEWRSAGADLLCRAAPWRTFRWHRGQRHYSGTLWSSTERDHVIYESRHELARLLFADFDQTVRRIVAQPFLLQAPIAGAMRRHVPDFLLLTEHGPVVVDIKPRHHVTKADVAVALAWNRAAVELCGWRYEVWSEPPRVELENLRFLAGYRRDWLFDRRLLDALRNADLDGVPLGSYDMDHPTRCRRPQARLGGSTGPVLVDTATLPCPHRPGRVSGSMMALWIATTSRTRRSGLRSSSSAGPTAVAG